MRTAFLSVLATGWLTATALSQAPRPKPADVPNPVKSQGEAPRTAIAAGQIEIYNGPVRTVRYVAPSLSPGERAALHDLERAENEAAYADELLALKRQYVADEQILEPQRRIVQQQLYGLSVESTGVSSYSGGFGGGFPGYYPYAYANPYGGGFGGNFGSYLSANTTTVVRSLANGVGDEGAIKTAMARQLATQAAPEYAAAAARGIDAALVRVGESDRLAKAFGIAKSDVRPAAGGGRILLTLKSGEKLEGTLYSEDADWFKVETATATVSVRKSDVTRVEQPKK